ncbi:MAG: hypothetical protein WDZ52_10400 [Pseudohongiellaceae bacterium]
MKYYTASLILLCLGLVSTDLSAQTRNNEAQKAEILSAVDRFFDALEQSDRAELENTTLAGSVFIASTTSTDGQVNNSTRSRAEFIQALSNKDAKRLERYWNPTLLIREGIAVFWAPYDFHIDGIFSHCGIDSFQLFRSAGVWKIGSSSYTVERQNCEPSPLGPI